MYPTSPPPAHVLPTRSACSGDGGGGINGGLGEMLTHEKDGAMPLDGGLPRSV